MVRGEKKDHAVALNILGSSSQRLLEMSDSGHLVHPLHLLTSQPAQTPEMSHMILNTSRNLNISVACRNVTKSQVCFLCCRSWTPELGVLKRGVIKAVDWRSADAERARECLWYNIFLSTWRFSTILAAYQWLLWTTLLTGVPVISDKRADQHHGTYVSPPRCIIRQLVITSTWISRDHLYLTFPALYANQHVHHRDRMPIGVITFAEFSRRPWYSRFCHKKCYTELVKFLLKQQLAKSSDFIREFWGNFSPSSPRHCCWLQLLGLLWPVVCLCSSLPSAVAQVVLHLSWLITSIRYLGHSNEWMTSLYQKPRLWLTLSVPEPSGRQDSGLKAWMISWSKKLSVFSLRSLEIVNASVHIGAPAAKGISGARGSLSASTGIIRIYSKLLRYCVTSGVTVDTSRLIAVSGLRQFQ